MINIKDGECSINGTPVEVLSDMATIVHALKDMLPKELIMMTYSLGMKEDQDVEQIAEFLTDLKKELEERNKE